MSSEACREELAYALDRALSIRGKEYPIIGIFPSAIESKIIPVAIKTRLYVSLEDVDWLERVKSAIDNKTPNISRINIKPYILNLYDNSPNNIVLEIRPRAGTWSPFFYGIPDSEVEKTQSKMNIGIKENNPFNKSIQFTSLQGGVDFKSD